LFFDVHQWPVCRWDLFLRFLTVDFFRHDCPIKTF
jgi:hypothetical protein